MNIDRDHGKKNKVLQVIKHFLLLSLIFIIVTLINSYFKYYIYVDFKNFEGHNGPVKMYFAESELDFNEELSLTTPLTVTERVRFPVNEELLLTTNFLRLDPCSCGGEFEIRDWGLTQGIKKISLADEIFVPFYQVSLKDGRYTSEGFNPRLHSDKLSFKKSVTVLSERTPDDYLKLSIISIVLYFLILIGARLWRLIFFFPLMFLIFLYFELRNGWKYLLFTYQQEASGEALQAILILLAAIISFSIFYRLKKDKKIRILHLFIGLALVFLFLEETSYLQRFFLYQTSSFFQTLNYQNEVTLHNLVGVNERVHLLFKIVGIYGSLSWILLFLPYLRNITFIRFLIPPKVTALYYFSLFSFYFLYDSQSRYNFVIPNIQESFELLLAIAIFIYAVRNFCELFQISVKIKEK